MEVAGQPLVLGEQRPVDVEQALKTHVPRQRVALGLTRRGRRCGADGGCQGQSLDSVPASAAAGAGTRNADGPGRRKADPRVGNCLLI
jgi:hypothetical protein